MKYSFSGHETFACKTYWLKKGLDYIKQPDKKFTDDEAVVELGVGKNMVASIRFWLKAYGMLDEQDTPTALAEYLFGDNGVDVYLEDTLTLWILHYQLIKQQKASIYNLVFSYFRKERNDFTKLQLIRFLQRKIEENKASFSDKTLDSDVRTFLSNYTSSNPTDIEEGYSNILQELNLITTYTQLDDQEHKVDWYRFDVSPKMDLPIEALLYVIKDNESYGNSISLTALANDEASLGSVFLLTEISLTDKLREIPIQYGVFTETAGNSVVQLVDGLDKWQILGNYYGCN